MGLTIMIALVARIAWLITLSIIFHRIKISWTTAQDNLKILKNQATFSATVNQCGDPLTAMNIPTANSYMLAASNDVDKAYWYCLSMILLLMAEIGIPLLLCVFATFCPCLKGITGPSTGEAETYSNGSIVETNAETQIMELKDAEEKLVQSSELAP